MAESTPPKSAPRVGARGQTPDLESSLTLLSSVLESPDDLVIFSLDREYRYTAFNSNHWRTMHTIWGVEIELGLDMLEAIKDPTDRQKARDNFDRALSGERFTKIEAYGETPNRFYYEDSYNPIQDSDGEVVGLTVFLKDITDRLEREAELERYRSCLEERVEERTRDLRRAHDRLQREIEERERTEALLLRAQRLEALGTLAGGVAHDFNNILTAIVGYSDLLLADLPSVEFAPDYLEKIKTAARHGSNLTSRLLAFSRRQMLQSTLVDLSEVVAQMADLFHHVLPEDIRLVTVLSGDLPLTRADRGQLEQVVMNLVVNARDAMPHGGKLDIETRVDADGWVHLVVADNGEGMTREVLDQVFDPFFTTKEPGAGSGLGLSMVYGIVDQHGGSLDLESTPGQGCRVEIKLPAVASSDDPGSRSEAEAGTASTDTDRSAGSTFRKTTVLLVEDDDAIRTMARLLMERRGYRVVDAGSCSEAIARFQGEAAGSVDLLFSDVVLPDGDGVGLASELLGHQPSLRVLLTSGYSESRVDTEELLGLPSYRFLSKPYHPKALFELIEALLPDSPADTGS